MAHPSRAPAYRASTEIDETRPTVRPLPLRLSRLPHPHANVTALLPVVEETFRSLGTSPPGPPHNDHAQARAVFEVVDEPDELTEDEIFAIWSARLI